jgi:GntR family transcriptional regulator
MYTQDTMFLEIRVDDARPIYQQVADGVRELIARGELAEGTALPPVRQLASDLGVNLNTIATAYRELQKDGLIVVKHGSGSVVAERRPTTKTPGELVTPLRTALMEFVLAGWSRERILDVVANELQVVAKGEK